MGIKKNFPRTLIANQKVFFLFYKKARYIIPRHVILRNVISKLKLDNSKQTSP